MLQNNMCFFPKVGGWRTHGPLLGEMSPKVACFFPPRWVGGDSPKRGTHWLETEAGKEGACVDQVLDWWPDDLSISWSQNHMMTRWLCDFMILSWDRQHYQCGQGGAGWTIQPLPSNALTLPSGPIGGLSFFNQILFSEVTIDKIMETIKLKTF